MKLLTGIAAGTFGVFMAVSASAATVNINTIDGIFTVVTPNDVTGLEGLNTNEILWGTPTESNKSGYSFTAAPAISDVPSNFIIGEFTHNNFPLSPTPSPASITGASLAITVTGDVDGTGFTLTEIFEFDHDETPNDGGLPCCDDIVTLLSLTGTGASVEAGDVLVELQLDGFVGTGNALQFFTQEDQSNTAELQGSFVISDIAPIPLPAAGWMLLAGVGALAAASRRKKKSA